MVLLLHLMRCTTIRSQKKKKSLQFILLLCVFLFLVVDLSLKINAKTKINIYLISYQTDLEGVFDCSNNFFKVFFVCRNVKIIFIIYFFKIYFEH